MCVCCNNMAEYSLDIRNDTNMQTQLIRKLNLLKAGRWCKTQLVVVIVHCLKKRPARLCKPWCRWMCYYCLLYPRHLCRGVYRFRLSVCPFVYPFVRLFVRSFVRSFVRTSVPFVELLQSFTFKQLEWSISHQPLTRKHSYLDHRYPGGSAFVPWLLTLGSMPRGGARGENLGHL